MQEIVIIEKNGKIKSKQNNKDLLQEHAWNLWTCYRNLSEEEKERKREYERNRYKNMSKTDKEKLY